ncbi:MAG TPA: C4-dicarboxylate ABC transporter, partial [Flexistipes sinusarabici]|nr:C4-dicarboxylate ABC transporter [Flexistipes sinusarabici]
AFALTLAYLMLPMFKYPKNKFTKFLSPLNKIGYLDYVFAIIAPVVATYLIWEWQDLLFRAGLPNLQDVIFGLALVILLLEATRRSIGTPLSVIALLFSLYGFFAESMPGVFAFKNVTIEKYVSQISLSTEGILGIPIGVSATIVFLFVLMGAMLDRAGAGQYFIDLAVSLLGRFRGGPAKASVVASGMSGMVSGSSIANVVTTGTFTIPLMKKVGYPPRKAAAVEVAASTNGQLMPPIMGAAAFIIAEYCNVSYIEVIKAAAVPAFASYAALFYITHLEACKLGIRGMTKEELPEFKKTFLSGLHYLIPIIWLIYELVVIRHSPQLAAYNTVLLLIVIIFYQEIKKAFTEKTGFVNGIKNSIYLVGSGFITGAKNMVGVALATASAGIVVGVVSLGLGGMITQIVDVLAQGNIYLLLLITAVASLLLGMGLPTTANYIVMASLTAPIIVQVGADYGFVVPLLAAHLFVFFFGILADDTPPVGLAAYAASAIADSPPISTGVQGFAYDIRTAIIPFMFIFNHDLILDGINSWPFGLFIFAMTLMASLIFSSAVQGWVLTKNKLFELPILLASSFV